MTDQEKKQLDGFKTENEYLRLKHGVLLTTAQRVEQGLKKFLTSPHLLLTEEHRADLKRLSTISTAHVENIVNSDPTKLTNVDPNSATALLNPYPKDATASFPDQLLLPLDKDTKGSQKPIDHVEPVAIKS